MGLGAVIGCAVTVGWIHRPAGPAAIRSGSTQLGCAVRDGSCIRALPLRCANSDLAPPQFGLGVWTSRRPNAADFLIGVG